MDGIHGAPESGASSLIARAKAIILTPKDEWPKIAAETYRPGDIFTRYALPLLAIGPIAGFIGGQAFGHGAFGFSYRPSFFGGLTAAIVGLVMAVISLVAVTFIADFLAPKFGGTAHRPAAFKLVAYSMTAAWVVGVFGLVPMLGFLGLLGLYSLYLFYLGATTLMKVPEGQAAGYTAVTVICAIVLSILLAMVTAPITALAGGSAALTGLPGAEEKVEGEMTIPGVGKVDLGKLEEASKKAEAMAKGEVKPVSSSELQGLLPTSIGAYQRTAVESGSMGQVGSTAEGTYEGGGKRFTLKVVDMSALGALSGIGAAMGVEQNREDADGYERTSTVDGQMQVEAWNKSGSGRFGHTVANRFMVEADGQAASIDELKAAVAQIDHGKLEALAN